MDNKIAIFVPNLLSRDGKEPVIGLERYVLALAELLTEMYYNVSFHQFSDKDFLSTYLQWPVYGYEAQPGKFHLTMERMEKSVPNRVLYSSIVQQVNYRPESICISHGVWWEVPGSNADTARKYYENYVLPALTQAVLVISCDYNFLNVSRAIYPDMANNKVRVIPNFVDQDIFLPRKDEEKKRLRILYPRRLSPERGFGLVKEIASTLLQDFPNLEFQFAIDTNISQYVGLFHTWRELEPFQERLLYSHPTFKEMPDVYAGADIVVIPSIYSEGMSLSCLEAMAMGKAVIATNVGGLTNIIIDGYNGLIIDPSSETLYYALRYLINNPSERSRLGANASYTAKAFSRKNWESRWRFYIENIYPV
jgi:glycosyltransferase involved in cell wall biosynthesis